jgi:acetyl-CoA carboxylase biotin carboxyl carrier protein
VSGPDAEPATERGLLALVDRLGVLLEENDLAELEVDADGTHVLLRRHEAPIAMPAVASTTPAPPAPAARSTGSAAVGPHADTAEDLRAAVPETVPALVAVISPLTGIFYASPAPGSAAYVQVGGEVAVGQVIGLVEAMKLFNEIKSHVAGRVVRIAAEAGALVKAKQTLIEVDPL